MEKNYHTSVVISQGEAEAINNVKILGSPGDWIPLPAKTEKGEPQFELIDNPSGWSNFKFWPEFDKGRLSGSKYTMHTLPTGATLVTKEENGQRKVGGWDFYDGGLENENPKYNVWSGALPDNSFSKNRMGSLDGDLL